MSLPPLYKYLDVHGANLTLGNKCFRFAKPSDYKDLEDMKAQSLFPDKLEKALPMLSDGFVDAIMMNLYAPPTRQDLHRSKYTPAGNYLSAREAETVANGAAKLRTLLR